MLVVVAVVSMVIGAAVPFGTPTASAATAQGPKGGGRVCKPAIDRTALLAQELGISVAELRAAQERAEIAAVQKAVELGRLDPERAEFRIAAIRLRYFLDPQAAAAQALGMTPEELQAACDGGQRLRDLLDARDMSPREFAQALRDALDAQVQEAVEAGIVTQEQADRLKKRAEHRFSPRNRFQGRQGPPPRRGGRGQP